MFQPQQAIDVLTSNLILRSIGYLKIVPGLALRLSTGKTIFRVVKDQKSENIPFRAYCNFDIGLTSHSLYRQYILVGQMIIKSGSARTSSHGRRSR